MARKLTANSDELEGEDAQVLGFRTSSLMALGYDWGEARRLAESGADHHEVKALLQRGASHSQAARIAV